MGNKTFACSILSILLILFSCKKNAGEGGAATIKGKLLAGNYNSPFASVSSDDAAADERVYIMYGDNETIDDDIRTSYDGSFEFRFLREGAYRVFAYSLDKNLNIPVETVVLKNLEIKGKKQTVEVTDFIIYKQADKGGTSAIKGKIFEKNYNGEFTVLLGSGYSPGERVFITYGNGNKADNDTRTGIDGSFQFDGLRKGTYKVFAMSKDSAKYISTGIKNPPDSVMVKIVEITANNQSVQIPDIVIYK